MRDLLLEIGCEELPPSYIDPALAFMKQDFISRLKELRLKYGKVTCHGTPRRLVLMATNVQLQQDDLEEEVTGPKAAIAYDEQGALTKVGQGFLRGKGLSEQDAFRKETKKGEVIAALVKSEGKRAMDLLPAQLSTLIAKIPFKKTMRWNATNQSFARPIRWICSLLGEERLDVSHAGVFATKESFGHRFMSPEGFEVTGLDQYQRELKDRFVLLEKQARIDKIVSDAKVLCEALGGQFRQDHELLETVSGLVEYPWPILGKYEERFLAMPKELLVSEMREHQKVFAVEKSNGDLLPAFVVVAGSRPVDTQDLAAGNARVILARFEDGAFYYESDKKTGLSEFKHKLPRMLFQRDLGSLADKTERVLKLAESLMKHLGNQVSSEEKAQTLAAAALCKADLPSGVVGEFPELQGVMGEHYALLQGETKGVAQSIQEHYLPRSSGDALPELKSSALLSIADRLDTLVGICAVGKLPKGSADPFALRRHGIALARLTSHFGLRYSLESMCQEAYRFLPSGLKLSQEHAVENLQKFMHARVKSVLLDSKGAKLGDTATTVIDGVMASGFDDIADLSNRLSALVEFQAHEREAFGALVATFKRVGNIVKKARQSGDAPEKMALTPQALTEKSELALLTLVQNLESQEQMGYEEKLKAISDLRPAVDKFFEDVMVMAEDKETRQARLNLLSHIESQVKAIADFTHIRV